MSDPKHHNWMELMILFASISLALCASGLFLMFWGAVDATKGVLVLLLFCTTLSAGLLFMPRTNALPSSNYKAVALIRSVWLERPVVIAVSLVFLTVVAWFVMISPLKFNFQLSTVVAAAMAVCVVAYTFARLVGTARLLPGQPLEAHGHAKDAAAAILASVVGLVGLGKLSDYFLMGDGRYEVILVGSGTTTNWLLENGLKNGDLIRSPDVLGPLGEQSVLRVWILDSSSKAGLSTMARAHDSGSDSNSMAQHPIIAMSSLRTELDAAHELITDNPHDQYFVFLPGAKSPVLAWCLEPLQRGAANTLRCADVLQTDEATRSGLKAERLQAYLRATDPDDGFCIPVADKTGGTQNVVFLPHELNAIVDIFGSKRNPRCVAKTFSLKLDSWVGDEELEIPHVFYGSLVRFRGRVFSGRNAAHAVDEFNRLSADGARLQVAETSTDHEPQFVVRGEDLGETRGALAAANDLAPEALNDAVRSEMLPAGRRVRIRGIGACLFLTQTSVLNLKLMIDEWKHDGCIIRVGIGGSVYRIEPGKDTGK